MPSTAPRVHRLLWYAYEQNGSHNRWLPPAQLLLVEAPNVGDAETVLLNTFGIDVWGGMGKHDCECCGRRWSPAGEDEGRETPEQAALEAGVNLEEYPPRDLSATDRHCPEGAVLGVLRVPWEPARA